MKLDKNPFGMPYFHIPTGRVIYLSNPAGYFIHQGQTIDDVPFWYAHWRFLVSMEVKAEDLRPAYVKEVEAERLWTKNATNESWTELAKSA